MAVAHIRDLRDKEILVIDDDLWSSDGIEKNLRRDGYKVRTANTSWHAIKEIKQGGFKTALIDLNLPPVLGISINGWDLIGILYANHHGVDIVVVSAEVDASVRIRAERLNVLDVLEKPLDMNRLKAILARAS